MAIGFGKKRTEYLYIPTFSWSLLYMAFALGVVIGATYMAVKHER